MSDHCCGFHLIGPSVRFPFRTLSSEILSHVTAWQKLFRAQTQSGAMTAASHFIRAESALQELCASAGRQRLRHQMSRADEVWSDTLEPTAVFTERIFSSWVCHLESGH